MLPHPVSAGGREKGTMLIRQELELADPAEAGAINRQLVSMPHQDVRTPEGLAELRAISHAPQGAVTVPATDMEAGAGGASPRVRTFACDGPARAVLVHVHGGGFCIGAPEEDDRWNAMLARECRVAVVSPEYRLAPEHPHPAGLDDCVAAALWAARQATVTVRPPRNPPW
jgi:acetyl esterase/lipase